jgi:hemerythrin-like domain-containing protein
MGPVEELREEHGAIMKVFAVLQEIGRRMEHREPFSSDHLGRIMEFLEVFVDQCHHGKEEQFLFPALGKKNLPSKDLLRELISEHHAGREMVRTMKEQLPGMSREPDPVPGQLVQTARRYMEIFRTHIRKENGVLFPEARQSLTWDEQQLMAGMFQRLEEEKIGKGRHEEFHRVIEMLAKSYGIGSR